MVWVEVAVSADAEAVEALAGLFRDFCHGGVAIEPTVQPLAEGGVVVDPAQPVAVRGYIPADGKERTKLRQLKTATDHLSFVRPISRLRTRRVAEDDWAHAWKEHYQVLHLGRSLVIVPVWRRYNPGVGELLIYLDPGMAFGTGLHPTTTMCLVELEKRVTAGAKVLDLGTGSGILAIAAARLGARGVLALDIDPVAASAARSNVELNRLQGIVQVVQGTISSSGQITPDPSILGPTALPPFDLVVANIIAGVIVEMAPGLAAVLAREGMLLASGIIAEREQEVCRALQEAGFAISESLHQGDWVTLVSSR
ncbi:MAG: 50S ribosomal protein L11 methyltransferase [Chloroflexota bacterium]